MKIIRAQIEGYVDYLRAASGHKKGIIEYFQLNNGDRIDCSREDLREIDFRDVIFESTDLKAIDFDNACIDQAKFSVNNGNIGILTELLSKTTFNSFYPKELCEDVKKVKEEEIELQKLMLELILRENAVSLRARNSLESLAAMFIPKGDFTFDKTKVLGEGHFGIVYLGKYNQEKIAVKQLKRPVEQPLLLAREVVPLTSLSRFENNASQHIVKFYGICSDYSPCVILMECVPNGLTLEEVLRGKNLNDEVLCQFAIDIAEGLSFLYGNGIEAHGDLKPSNILVKKINNCRYAVKLSDFGLIKTKQEDTKYADERGVYSTIGDIYWRAPELLSSAKEANEKTDVYSYGRILWAMFCREERPFKGKNPGEAADMLIKGENPKVSEDISPIIRNLIEACWEKIEERVTIDYVLRLLKSRQQQILQQTRFSTEPTMTTDVVVLPSQSASDNVGELDEKPHRNGIYVSFFKSHSDDKKNQGSRTQQQRKAPEITAHHPKPSVEPASAIKGREYGPAHFNSNQKHQIEVLQTQREALCAELGECKESDEKNNIYGKIETIDNKLQQIRLPSAIVVMDVDKAAALDAAERTTLASSLEAESAKQMEMALENSMETRQAEIQRFHEGESKQDLSNPDRQEMQSAVSVKYSNDNPDNLSLEWDDDDEGENEEAIESTGVLSQSLFSSPRHSSNVDDKADSTSSEQENSQTDIDNSTNAASRASIG